MFVPIIPVIVATGLILGLKGALLNDNFLGLFGASSADIPQNILVLLDVLSGTTFSFMPALVCRSAFKTFGGNPVLGIVLGLMLVSTSLPNAYSVADPSSGVTPLYLFNFIPIVGYQGSVLPAFAVVLIGAKFEKFLHKKVPATFDLLITPFVILVVMMCLALIVIGPILHVVEQFVLNTLTMFMGLPFDIDGFLIGFFWSIYWYDIFTGTRYKGGMTKDFYRNNESIPVFVKAGTMLPLSAEVENSAKNPESFEVLVFAGDSGSFKMIEDKDEKAETRLETEFVYSWDKAPKLTISASGCFESVPENRRYSVKVYGQSFENVSVFAGGKPVDYEVSQKEKSSYTITLHYMKADTKLEIVFGNNELAENPVLDMTEKILNMASIEYDKKLEIFTAVKNNMDEKMSAQAF